MAAPPAPAPNFRPWVLLLVDDEPDILTSIKSLLEASVSSLKVITAQSGRIALELLDRERVDLIVSDFKMPGMDGIEFLYQCRRQHPAIPRVMLTAFGNEDLARRAVSDAVVGAFLSKGAEPEQLVAGISKLLDYHPSSDPPPPPPVAPPGSIGVAVAPASPTKLFRDPKADPAKPRP